MSCLTLCSEGQRERWGKREWRTSTASMFGMGLKTKRYPENQDRNPEEELTLSSTRKVCKEVRQIYPKWIFLIIYTRISRGTSILTLIIMLRTILNSPGPILKHSSMFRINLKAFWNPRKPTSCNLTRKVLLAIIMELQLLHLETGIPSMFKSVRKIMDKSWSSKLRITQGTSKHSKLE